MVCITGFRGKLPALTPGAPARPASSLTLVSAELLLTHHLTPLSCCRDFPPPHLKHVVTEVLPPSLMGSALASSESVLESSSKIQEDIAGGII